MNPKQTIDDLPFGTELGTSQGGVVSYSSDYDSADENQYPNRSAYRSYVDGIYMGYKWQCVEFARRWLYINKGYIFDDVSMAYEIFKLRSVRDISNNTELPLNAFKNGSIRHPKPGCLLIWDEGGEFEETGHVAIITEVFADKIRIVEQNMDFVKWPEGKIYSREINANIGDNNDYWLQCPSHGSEILGWVIQTDIDDDAVTLQTPNSSLFNIKAAEVKNAIPQRENWLNMANPDEAAYVKMMKGHKLSSNLNDRLKYYAISDTAADELERATDELHGMFMHATDYVLDHPQLLATFGLPPSILPKIRKSWGNRKNQLVTSRFDFAMSETGLKVYEYNCDSASCYMEVAKVQGKWAKNVGLKGKVDAGGELFSRLVKAWQQSGLKGTIHLLQDDDPEETYHALFMQKVIEAAGYDCVHVIGLSSLLWNSDGEVMDSSGNIIACVWKTWAWETALEQLRWDEDTTLTNGLLNSIETPHAVRLADVLLSDNIMVFEPLWTLIPSNKAILPVLWDLFPNHPYLLNTRFKLTEELINKGYVTKPIVGRCGSNIQLVDKHNQILAEKAGEFADRVQIFQELHPLPQVGEYFVQLCSFTAAGNYAGSGTRVDPSLIIGNDSDCLALIIENDDYFSSFE